VTQKGTFSGKIICYHTSLEYSAPKRYLRVYSGRDLKNHFYGNGKLREFNVKKYFERHQALTISAYYAFFFYYWLNDRVGLESLQVWEIPSSMIPILFMLQTLQIILYPFQGTQIEFNNMGLKAGDGYIFKNNGFDHLTLISHQKIKLLVYKDNSQFMLC